MVTIGKVVAWSIIFTFVMTTNLYASSIKTYKSADKPSSQDDKNFISDMVSSYPEIISLVDDLKLGRVESSDGKLSLILPTAWKSDERSTPQVISLVGKSAALIVSKVEISSENMDRYSPENILTIYAMSLIGKNGHTHDKLRVIKSGKRVMTSMHILETKGNHTIEYYYTMQLTKGRIYLIGVSVNPAYEQLGKFLSELALYSLLIEEMEPMSVSSEAYDELPTSLSKPHISLSIDSDNEKAIGIANNIPSNVDKIYASTTTDRLFANETLSIKWYRYFEIIK